MKKENMKKVISLVIAAMFLCAMSVVAFASEVPDLDRTGSITVTLRDGKKLVSGGSLTLYKVGDIDGIDGDFIYVWTDDFVNCGLHPDSIQSESLAKDLADYAQKNCKGVTRKIDENGTVKFSNLSVGLYLIVQTESPKNYNSVNPFLVTIPLTEDGEYVYDVNASPKVEIKTETTAPHTVTTTTPSTEPELPSTGQPRWPIPVLAVSGIVLFAAGFMMYSSRRKKQNEK